jgi:hypothetical protein
MGKKLGIYVSSDGHLDELIELCRAAQKKEVEVLVFLTHVGTRLSQDPRFEKLTRLATVSLCKVGFEGNGFKPPIAGLDENALASQSWHAEMIYDCDRYLAF